jgi:hypothetical protein
VPRALACPSHDSGMITLFLVLQTLFRRDSWLSIRNSQVLHDGAFVSPARAILALALLAAAVACWLLIRYYRL